MLEGKSLVYERPRIVTLRAEEITESMGPVSCGSGAQNSTPDPVTGAVSPFSSVGTGTKGVGLK